MINIGDHTGWWGLLGLLVPFIIHLLSKKEKTVIPFGSLRFLRPLESDSAKSIELTQYTLLLLRLLLVGLIAFMITRPFITQENSNKVFWVEEGVYSDPSYKDVISKIPEDAELKVFSFEKGNSERSSFYPSAWTLINDVNTLNDSAVVYTHSLQKNFVGHPVMLGNYVDWNIVPTKGESVEKQSFKNNEIITWSIESDANRTTVNKDKTDSKQSGEESIVVIQLVDNSAGLQGKRLQTVIDLIEDNLPYRIQWQENEGESADWKIIIGDSQDHVDSNMIMWIPSTDLLQVEQIAETVLTIKGDIKRESLLESNLPVILTSMFNKEKIRLSEYDNRVLMPPHVALASDESRQTIKETSLVKKPIESYLLFLLLPLFVAERFVNYKSGEL